MVQICVFGPFVWCHSHRPAQTHSQLHVCSVQRCWEQSLLDILPLLRIFVIVFDNHIQNIMHRISADISDIGIFFLSIICIDISPKNPVSVGPWTRRFCQTGLKYGMAGGNGIQALKIITVNLRRRWTEHARILNFLSATKLDFCNNPKSDWKNSQAFCPGNHGDADFLVRQQKYVNPAQLSGWFIVLQTIKLPTLLTCNWPTGS